VTTANRLEFRILGPLSVRVDGAALPLGGPKQRALLALLLLSANRIVSRDRLIGELFREQSLNSADHALRNHVSRLRKVLAGGAAGEPRLVARAPGYLLRVEPGELDLERFEQLVAAGRELLADGDAEAAVRSLRAAEELWEGQPLADLELEPFVRVDVDRLEELRLAAVEERVDAELALGRHLAVVPELEALAIEHPFRERFRAQLMLALYRCGRQAESLEAYRRARQILDDELGLEPGTELQEMQRAILVQDPTLDARAGGRTHTATPLRGITPYKGLAPFEAGDAELYFGRERLVAELADRLRDVPFLAIIGSSGSGKSSLLRAGLLPALGLDGLVVRAGDGAPQQLADALEATAATERLVIAVDQFEEVFGEEVDDDERRALLSAIVEAAWDPARRFVVVVALRADFFPRLAPYRELADLVAANQVLLGPMGRSELRRAITGPAARTGVEVEPELVDALVDDLAGEAGALPLLSTALLDLWRAREGDTLTLAAHERTGGVRGAVARHAEAAFTALPPDDRAHARRILLRLASGGDGEVAARRRVARTELDDDPAVERVLSALVERRLVVADGGLVELVHEALLVQWPRLAAWLEDDARGRRLRSDLAQQAARWEAAGRDATELYRGARLAAALEWAESAGDDAALNRLEHAFLVESRRAAARATRRLRAALAVALLLLAGTAVAAVAALSARGAARRQATDAVAQRLGAQALVEPSLDRSLLLARAGVALHDSPATESNLLAALLRAPAALAVAHGDSDRLLDEAISPDGRTLAVRSDNGSIAFFSTRTLHRLVPSLPGSDQIGLVGAVQGPLRALAFSPDGRTLAVGGTDGHVATVQLVDAGSYASRAEVASSGLITTDVAFAPGGRRFATAEALTGRVSPPPAVITVRDARTGVALARSRPIVGARLVGYALGGRLLLVAASSSSLLLDATTLRVVRRLPLPAPAALSSDSRSAAFARRDGSVTIVDLNDGRRRTLVGRASGTIETLAFSSRARLVAAGSDDGTITVWEHGSGTVADIFDGHSAPVTALAFAPDGRTLYSASFDGGVIAWDVTGARRLGARFRFAPASAGSGATAVAPGGAVFAISSGAGRVQLWRPSPPAPAGPPFEAPIGDVQSIAFSADGSLLAAAGSRRVAVWDERTRRLVRALPVGGYGLSSVVFAPNSHDLGLGRLDGGVAIYDVDTGKKTMDALAPGSTSSISFSRDGKLLASASLTGVTTIWDTRTGRDLADLGGAIAAYAAAFSPDGRDVAVGDSTGRVVLWDVAARRPAGDPLLGHGDDVESIAFSPSGRTLVTAGGEGKLRLWDLATGRVVGGPLPGSTRGGSVAFFPGGKRVVGAFRSGVGVVWDVDPAAWEARACSVAGRTLTRAEWAAYAPSVRYRDVCGSS